MNKLHGAFFLLFLLIGTCACSDGAGNPAADPAPEDASASTVLTAWAWDVEFNIYALQRAADFYRQGHPGFELNIVEGSKADICQRLNVGLTAGATGDLPDIVPIEDYTIASFLASYPGRFRDLTDEINYENFALYKQDSMAWRGRKYGIPWDTGAVVMYFRRDILERAGYTTEDIQDITWDDYIDIAKTIKEKTGCHISSIQQDTLGDFRIYMQSVGVWYTRKDGVTPYFENNPAMEEGLRLVKTLLENDLSLAAANRSEQQTYLYNGEIASFYNGCWFTPTIRIQEEQHGLWMMAPLPKFELPGATHYSNNGGGAWYVFADRPGTEDATRFLVETFGENQALYDAMLEEKDILSTYLPSWKSDVVYQKNDFFGGQQTALFVTQQARSIPPTNYGIYTYECEEILRNVILEVLGGKDIDTALAEAQLQADARIL